MKFIISESQYKILKESSKKTRSEKLILSLYNQDKTIGMIKTITGFNLNLIIETLKDVFIIENFNCQQMKDLFYHYIFGSELIKKSYTYNDGSMVDVFYHHFDGTLSFNYYVEDRWVSGYATFLYEGECEIPFDGSSVSSDVTKLTTYNLLKAFNDKWVSGSDLKTRIKIYN